MIYGYIEDGFLRAKSIEPLTTNYQDEDGDIKQKTVSVEEQIKELPAMWKPVDDIDESKQHTDKEYYTIQVIPYDAGERISFKYVEVPDIGGVKQQIAELKAELANSDYKVLKCYEANLIGATLPYDMTEVHEERQTIRDNINELESVLESLITL